MRYVIELYCTSDSVYGNVTRENSDVGQPFNGWLELLALLEPPLETPHETEDTSSST